MYVRTELSRKGALIEEAVLTKHDKTEGDTVPVVYADTLATYLPPMDEGALSTSVKYNIRTVTGKTFLPCNLRKCRVFHIFSGK